jgi:hypothetical protein
LIIVDYYAHAPTLDPRPRLLCHHLPYLEVWWLLC